MNAISTDRRPVVYWHRELPPIGAEPMGEHILEAASSRVSGNIDHRSELWDQCYEELMTQARSRLEQEVARLGGSCVHVLSESVDSRHDDATGKAWLHGQFTYVLYSERRRVQNEPGTA